MSRHHIPLLLDGGLHVDNEIGVSMDEGMTLNDVDLFGDAAMEGALELPARSVLSGPLSQRLDELTKPGCCQGIAWSKQGTIASISRDGRSIELRFLRSNPTTGMWELAGPDATSSHHAPDDWTLFKHLVWAATPNPEIAIMDNIGRINIINSSVYTNRTNKPVSSWVSDPKDDVHTVVGCYWLPLALGKAGVNGQVAVPPGVQISQLAIPGPASWNVNENVYKYEGIIQPTWGPFNPNQLKSALVSVTATGYIRLLFQQQPSNQWEERLLELDRVTSPEEAITHAAIVSDRYASLSIALATVSGLLKLVRVGIRWGATQPFADKAPPSSMPLDPSLKDRQNVALVDMLSYGQLPDTTSGLLSHIELLPCLVDGRPHLDHRPIISNTMVLTVRSYAPVDNFAYQDAHSIIERWEVVDQQIDLHPAFALLAHPSAQDPCSPIGQRLKKLETILIPRVVVSVTVVPSARVLCFAFSDGTIQYRDRLTMAELYHEVNLDSVMSLHQVGFCFAERTPCLQLAFSPTNTSFVQIGEDAKVRWNSLQYKMADFTSGQDRQFKAVLAGLTVALSTADVLTACIDDLLAAARAFDRSQESVRGWIKEIVTTLKVPIDHSEDSLQEVVKSNRIITVLSIIHQLGFQGEFQPRSFLGRFATSVLAIRHFTMFTSIVGNQNLNFASKNERFVNPMEEAGVVDLATNYVKWISDLVTRTTDDLFNLLEDSRFMHILTGDPHRFAELAPYLQEVKNTSLMLVLASMPRKYLLSACQRVNLVVGICLRNRQRFQNERPNEYTRSMIRSYQRMYDVATSSLIKADQFCQLLEVLGKDIRTAYHTSPSTLPVQDAPATGRSGTQPMSGARKAQAQYELDMLLGGNPPPSLRDVLANFFNVHLRALRDSHPDRGELYFHDYRLLELDEDLPERRELRRRVDTYKRVEMLGDASGADELLCRRCVRCAAVMQELDTNPNQGRPAYMFVFSQFRKCPCGGSWSLLINRAS